MLQGLLVRSLFMFTPEKLPPEKIPIVFWANLCSCSPDTACKSSASGSTGVKEVAVCVAGAYNGDEYENMKGLCSFACSYGFCPSPYCTCGNYGSQVDPPAGTLTFAYYTGGADDGLCTFTCSHGYCVSYSS
jgi:hypothetical protein